MTSRRPKRLSIKERPKWSVAGSRTRPDTGSVLFLHLIIAGILGFAGVAVVGAAKGIFFLPPPSELFALVLLILGVVLMVVDLAVWVFIPVFNAIRAMTASPATQVKLATDALKPILSLLKLLPRVPIRV